MSGTENTSVTYVVSTTLICYFYCCIVKERYKKFDSIFFTEATCYMTQIIHESGTLGTAEDAIFSCGGYFYHYLNTCVEVSSVINV